MKTSKYLEELKGQSVTDLNAQLVEAKKELFNLRFHNESAGQHKQNQRSKKEYCKNSDNHY